MPDLQNVCGQTETQSDSKTKIYIKRLDIQDGQWFFRLMANQPGELTQVAKEYNMNAINYFYFDGVLNNDDLKILNDATHDGMLETIYMGDATVENQIIPDDAFSNNGYENESSLKAIWLAAYAKKIGANAFKGAVNLESLQIPYYLEEIGAGAFSGCMSLKESTVGYDTDIFKIPDAVKVIPDDCFRGCLGLENIILPEQLESIGDHAFSGANIDYINFPASLKTIGAGAFSRAFMPDTVIIPKTVATIGEGAFQYARRLACLSVECELTEIPADFATGVLFSKLLIPATVKKIGNRAFASTLRM